MLDLVLQYNVGFIITDVRTVGPNIHITFGLNTLHTDRHIIGNYALYKSVNHFYNHFRIFQLLFYNEFYILLRMRKDGKGGKIHTVGHN